MGNIICKNIGGLGKHDNTAQEYDHEVTFELLKNRLKHISNALTELDDKYSFFVVGMGGQPKAVYNSLAKELGLSLIWSGSTLPKYLRFLGGLVASHSGVFKVNDLHTLSTTFSILVEQSMAGIYVFPKEYELKFTNNFKNEEMSKEFDYGIKLLPDYFYYIVDADNYESNTGMYEIVSYGKKANYISSIL